MPTENIIKKYNFCLFAQFGSSRNWSVYFSLCFCFLQPFAVSLSPFAEAIFLSPRPFFIGDHLCLSLRTKITENIIKINVRYEIDAQAMCTWSSTSMVNVCNQQLPFSQEFSLSLCVASSCISLYFLSLDDRFISKYLLSLPTSFASDNLLQFFFARSLVTLLENVRLKSAFNSGELVILFFMSLFCVRKLNHQ